MAPDTPVWQPAIFTRPERNMTISRLWVNYQCAELHPGLRTSPQCNVPAPTTPAGFETWADSTLRVASQRSNQLGQRVRPAGEKLAGRLDCHTVNRYFIHWYQWSFPGVCNWLWSKNCWYPPIYSNKAVLRKEYLIISVQTSTDWLFRCVTYEWCSAGIHRVSSNIYWSVW